jgi:hypothetical protein
VLSALVLGVGRARKGASGGGGALRFGGGDGAGAGDGGAAQDAGDRPGPDLLGRRDAAHRVRPRARAWRRRGVTRVYVCACACACGRYACIMVLALDLVVVSLLAGTRMHGTLLSPDSALMRHLLSLVRYAFLLSKVLSSPSSSSPRLTFSPPPPLPPLQGLSRAIPPPPALKVPRDARKALAATIENCGGRIAGPAQPSELVTCRSLSLPRLPLAPLCPLAAPSSSACPLVPPRRSAAAPSVFAPRLLNGHRPLPSQPGGPPLRSRAGLRLGAQAVSLAATAAPLCTPACERARERENERERERKRER